MKVIIVFAIISWFMLEACNKSHDSPVTPVPPGPPVTDSTVTDTTYLRKTETTYFYYPSTLVIADSNQTTWKYDNQRRVIRYLYVASHGTYIDTATTSYLLNQQKLNIVTYLNNALNLKSSEVFYLNSLGKPDSAVTSFLYPYVFTPGQVDYYYYDANGNDTLIEVYQIANNLKSLLHKTRHTYKNYSLDSEIVSDPNGLAVYINSFASGNLISTVTYENGSNVVAFASGYTYENTLSGGFYGDGGDKNLRKTWTQTFPSTVSETFTYTFDKSNRVDTVFRSKSNVLYAKEIYTYY